MFEKWLNKPDKFQVENSRIMISADGKTDFFVDPALNVIKSNAPLYMKEMEGDFSFSCKVKPLFNMRYDAGAIMLYIDDYNWIKFAFENTDLGYPAVVSVLTKDYSDDCNGEEISSESIYLKISRKDGLTGFYYSSDGITWKMKRLCRFEGNYYKSLFLGIEAQSPVGEGCKVEFSEMVFLDEAVDDFRIGV